ncbi:hypothetical protein CLAIMM_13439 [Cladophialophora immunda]|nr:hypothetical protein CLAIMM_13439 [Cladophialophora immunda]
MAKTPRNTRGAGPDGVVKPRSSGIKVIVIGLGYSGAAAAVECHRKGHDVVVYEQWPGITQLGDIIGITGNAAQIIAKWGNGSVHRRLSPLLSSWRANNIRKYDTGEILYAQPMVGYNAGSGYTAPRGPMAIILASHLRELGIPIHFGKRIQDYFENETEAGVVVDGEKITADCVLACDGVHSKARSFVVGVNDRPYPTGYATYRAWFDAAEAKKNPDLAWMFEGDSDKMETYIGQDMHCILGTCSGMRGVVWNITHKDIYDNVAESWSFPGKHEDVLSYVKGWNKRIHDVAMATPKTQLVDYKLVWRDPLPKWVSKNARYARASLAQQIGKETREIWHKTDWELAKKDPQSLSMPLPKWLFGHDPQQYAYDEFDAAASSIVDGTEYVPKNIPPPGQNHRVFDFEVKDASPWIRGGIQPRARL